MVAVMGNVLFPGLMVMLRIVALPTMPDLAVERESDTLPYITKVSFCHARQVRSRANLP